MIVNGFQIPPSHSPQEVFQDDLSDAYAALGFMRDAGFKLDWLEKKLYEVSERKKNEEAGLKEMEEDLRDLKHKCSDMEALANEEKESGSGFVHVGRTMEKDTLSSKITLESCALTSRLIRSR
ncbi:unnamed protein product [Brassica oleracea var. botrytis]|uniref:(rape) hypothetical protein n=1 Tax=Brassica napus TaxID=3708 RepID=A0A816IN13_BRANA|nr:unnamed protein product [Brassica napus]